MCKPQARCSFGQQLNNIICYLALFPWKQKFRSDSVVNVTHDKTMSICSTFITWRKIQQKDILMIKSLQPSVGVMKWLALAEDLDDLSLSAGSICCAAESKAQPFPVLTTISNLIIIKTSSVTFINPTPGWILEDLQNRAHHMLPFCVHTWSCEQRQGN